MLSSSVQSQRCRNFSIFLGLAFSLQFSILIRASKFFLVCMGDIDSLSRNKKLGTWWKLRIKYLAEHDRKRDARALFLEFKNDERVRRS